MTYFVDSYLLLFNIFFYSFQIHENDDLPTKICLNCEEKMVSFQLFVLECYKAQETLKNLCYELSDDIRVKLEAEIDFGGPVVKSEVTAL